jgi:hypothetical protein
MRRWPGKAPRRIPPGASRPAHPECKGSAALPLPAMEIAAQRLNAGLRRQKNRPPVHAECTPIRHRIGVHLRASAAENSSFVRHWRPCGKQDRHFLRLRCAQRAGWLRVEVEGPVNGLAGAPEASVPALHARLCARNVLTWFASVSSGTTKCRASHARQLWKERDRASRTRSWHGVIPAAVDTDARGPSWPGERYACPGHDGVARV